MARNKVNLKMQCMQKLESLAAYGQKKDDKDSRFDSNYNSNRSQKIHSYQTMKNYKNFASSFCDWMKDNHAEVKKIEQIDTAHVREYVESRHADGYSNYTLSAHVSCLNKICHNEDRDFWKLSQFGDYKRHSDDITNSRGIKTDWHTDHYERNASAILMVEAFGIRRSSCESATCNQLVYKDEKIIGIEIQEKGGKIRVAPLLESYADRINNYFQERISQYGESCRICENPDRNVNLHALRSEWSCNLYHSLRENPSYYEHWRERYINEEAVAKVCSHPRYDKEYIHGYHTETVALVSQGLGHNRLSVVFNHYLREDE